MTIMTDNKDNIRTRAWFVAKVLLWYFFYQVACTLGFQLLAWIAEALGCGTGLFTDEAMLCGSLFLSALLMLWHLLTFGYVKISAGIVREVQPGVLFRTILLIFGSMYLFNVLLEWIALPDLMEQTFMDMSDNTMGMLSMALLAPVVEELMFRGAIQGYLMRRCSSPWTGIVVSALVFGAIHMNPQQVAYATALGLVFGWIYYRTRSLLPVIAGHILNNSVAVVTMKVWGNEDIEAVTTDNNMVMVPFLMVLAVMLIMLTLKINRELPAVPRPWRGAGEQ